MAMEKQQKCVLKSIFLPFLSTSHIIPLVDMARVFSLHNIDVTIITTKHNASIFQNSIDLDSTRGRSIRTHLIDFPATKVGLPIGIESFNVTTPREMIPKVYMGLAILQPEIEHLFHELQPDFIVTDMFHPWTADTALKLGIPRIMFVPASYLSRAAAHSVEHYAPHLKVTTDTEKFIIPDLPNQLEMTRLQLPDWLRSPNQYTELMKMIKESEKKSFGSVFNSFYELEGDYYDHYKKVTGTKSWGLGPVYLWVNEDDTDKVARGNAKGDDEEEEEEGWLKWLNSKPEGSVIYVSFGSMNKFPYLQLVEIAKALENCGHYFIWVVRKNSEGEGEGDTFLEEFEKKMKENEKGYLIWGWAPQLLILENSKIGGLVSHCGWNTVVETVNVGLPTVTWPLFAEHFFNEKLVVDVLGIGVPVGVKEWRNWNEFGNEVVKCEEIEKAIGLMMSGSEEVLAMRKRAKQLSVAAKKTIQVGGSSHNNMVQLIQELKSFKLAKGQQL